MVKIVNLFKAAGVWVGTIFLLYGTQDVDRTVAQAYGGYGGTYKKGRGGLAPTRSVYQSEIRGLQSPELSLPHHWQSDLETRIGGQVGHGGLVGDKSGRFRTPVTERGGGYG